MNFVSLLWCHLLRVLRPALLALAACQPAAPPAPAAAGPSALRARFFRYLYAGDSVYAQKDGYDTFRRSLVYYDSAQALAHRSNDTLLLAEAVFAKGRVYDAWNKAPAKTVDHFQQAADLFRRLPGSYLRYLYARHLVAHAYDKVPDSLRAVQVLRSLRRELSGRPDTLLRQVPFTVEMALISTEVRNYALADSLLSQLTRRAWICNDPNTYDYLHHYYLVQSRLDVYYRRQPASRYLDSLRAVHRRAATPFDRLYYADNLARLSAAAGQHAAAYTYLKAAHQIQDSLDSGGDSEQLRRALLQSEEAEIRHRRAYAAAQNTNRHRLLVLLSGGLGVISLLSFHLHRQSRRANAHAAHLAQLNQELDDKVAQVELLYKEIQHRVKNNLHMIFSLLHMQERRTDNDEVVEQLQAARLRVESIAALHNQLLQHPDELDLSAYLRQLISSVVACLANERQVITHLSTGALHLPVNSYFPLSLILNEWVTNSIKYARTGAGLLEINVRVHHRPHDTCIEYHDNGQPALPAPPYAAGGEAGGLGTQIITLLTRQLGATLSTRPNNPYHYELCIPHGTRS